MEGIASTFKEANLPDGFHLGAAELYKRLRFFKDIKGTIPISEVINAIRSGELSERVDAKINKT
jgi:hypothetical protein